MPACLMRCDSSASAAWQRWAECLHKSSWLYAARLYVLLFLQHCMCESDNFLKCSSATVGRRWWQLCVWIFYTCWMDCAIFSDAQSDQKVSFIHTCAWMKHRGGQGECPRLFLLFNFPTWLTSCCPLGVLLGLCDSWYVFLYQLGSGSKQTGCKSRYHSAERLCR